MTIQQGPGDSTTAPFAWRQSNTLAHALVAHLGHLVGVRVLSIKGLVTEHYGLRPPRPSSDADVLVEPAGLVTLRHQLALRGWHERVAREVPAPLDPHSTTLIHQEWPTDIDLHAYYPGFFADPAVTFDRLWATSCDLAVAHTTIRVPSRAGAAAISALHEIRYRRSPRHQAEFSSIQQAVASFTPQDQHELADVIRTGRAQWVLADVLQTIGVQPVDDASPEQKRAWSQHWAAIEEGAAVTWLSALLRAPIHRKPGILFRSLWISRQDIPRTDPSRLPSRREAWEHRRLRWRRGFSALVRRRTRSHSTD